MVGALDYIQRLILPRPVHGPSCVESRALLLDRFQQHHRAIPIPRASGLYAYAEDETRRIHRQRALALAYLLPSIAAPFRRVRP